ncbi:serine hydrolase-domain-containing protein [Pisolithus orientalis]|uniref:serine hydrolase-domain-containing protein n=1 Tax=Pisolithus orientalis TaxID=936130 RepID=UPI002225638D|nr:serine hydrolase-domain-containing protein [Pisolithus orientalis]KAI6007677.1 serine hydrolase-domain-containing protein [Pisolithus orientalis]
MRTRYSIKTRSRKSFIYTFVPTKTRRGKLTYKEVPLYEHSASPVGAQPKGSNRVRSSRSPNSVSKVGGVRVSRPMSAARKILMLHGHSQNGDIFSKRVGTAIVFESLVDQMHVRIYAVFIDAPIILQPIDLDGDPSNVSLNSFGASEANAASSDPALTPRAWWKANPERTTAHGLEESLMVLRDVLTRDRFDGVFGFSQGAAMAALLAALLEKPHAYEPFLIGGEAPHPRFQFCVAVSGFKAHIETPTLHVIGKTDVIVVEERSKALLSVSANARVEVHEGGHFVPSQAKWRVFWREYLRDPSEHVPSPGLVSKSQTNSGMNTPPALDYP